MQFERSISVMPFRTTEMEGLLGVRWLVKLYSLHGYWQISLSLEAQEVFTIHILDGLYTPTRVSQGASNAIPYL